MRVLDIIQRSAEFLAKKGVDSPRLQAELLLAHVLRLPRMQLYLNFERVLTSVEQDTLRELVKRRGAREPLQYILGSTCFCGLEIPLDRNVLIPRPETELLAEAGWLFLNQRSSTQTSVTPRSENVTAVLSETPMGPTALDFGTGSGCLAIALAVKCSSARIVALDVVPEALNLARRNAAQQSVAERIRFVLSDGLSNFPATPDFDLIVANPPYIPSSEIDTLQPEVRSFEPRRALDGGPDGLDFYRQLAGRAAGLLTPGGTIMLEFGDGQQESITKLFQSENWIVERIVKDYTDRPRILVARGMN